MDRCAPSRIHNMPSIGLLGGTFNPIHQGHVYLAQQAMQALSLSQVRFIPCHLPALKDQPCVSAEQRAHMVQLAIQDHADWVLDRCELARTGVSYTVDTLRHLRQQMGEQVSLIWLMGSDAYANIQQWHQWSSLLRLCHIVVIQRPDSTTPCPLSTAAQTLLQQHQVEQIAALHQSPHGHIFCLDIAAPDIASSVIRQRIKQAQDIQQLLPQAVAAYIHQHQLYTD